MCLSKQVNQERLKYYSQLHNLIKLGSENVWHGSVQDVECI